MTDLPGTDHAGVGLLRRDGACLREGVARWQRCQRNAARTMARTTTTNEPNHQPQRWVEKVGRSITNSETPHSRKHPHRRCQHYVADNGDAAPPIAVFTGRALMLAT